jgi:hypothetical protein
MQARITHRYQMDISCSLIARPSSYDTAIFGPNSVGGKRLANDDLKNIVKASSLIFLKIFEQLTKILCRGSRLVADTNREISGHSSTELQLQPSALFHCLAFFITYR